MELRGGRVGTSASAVTRAPARSTAAWVAAGGAGVAAAASVLATLPLDGRGGTSVGLDVVGAVGVLGCAALGVLLVLRSEAPHLGWLLLGAAVSLGVLNATYNATIAHELGAIDLGRWALPVAWVQHWSFTIPTAIALGLLPLRLPDGTLPSTGWRRWERVVVGLTVGVVVLLAVVDGPLGNAYETALAVSAPDNPWGLVPRASVEAVGTVGIVVLSLGVPLVAAVGLVVRFVRSDQVRRRQLGWVGLGLAGALVLGLVEQVVGWLHPGLGDDGVLGHVTGGLAVLVLVAALGAAVLRYRLWDVDLVVNRSAVGTLMTVAIVAVYAAGVGAAGVLFEQADGWVTGVLGAGLVAALVHPVRTGSQRLVNRVMFGDRDDPMDVLDALGRELATAPDDRDALWRLAETVASALHVPHVAVEVDGKVVAACGDPVPTERFPLRHRGVTLGALHVAPRSARETLGPRDRHLLARVADHAGLAAHAARLAAAVQAARVASTAVREEERRRLRRDLHDGLGPTLAGHSLALERAIHLVEDGDPDAVALLERLHDQTRALVGDVRALVHDLRPPALDELGLLRALRELVAGFGPSPQVTVDHRGGDLSRLSAASEAAAYRIVAEAVTNVVRHADARTCAVVIEVAGDRVRIMVTDDGRGRPADAPIGTGTASMTERAEALGGRLHVAGRDGAGTTVTATLPLGTTP